jgi:Trk K+ transport system NAD-binding subunit
MPHRKRSRLRVAGLYARALVHEFRWTLLALLALVAFASALNYVAAEPGKQPSVDDACYNAWMALLAQAPRPDAWYLKIVNGIYPLFGVVLLGEGVVRLGLLLASKRQGEKEWMRVMASTYRGHIILCGLGHLGYRVLEQLLAIGQEVIALEQNQEGRFVAQAKAKGVPVLARDMKDDEALAEAEVAQARAIIIATNDDMANLEVALDARRMNPGIKVIMRLFDQQIASKLSGALTLDAAFSSSALAAPVVAALAIDSHVLAAYQIGGVPHVAFEFQVPANSALAGRSVASLESEHGARVLARTPKDGGAQMPPGANTVLTAGDVLVIHAAVTGMSGLTAAQGSRAARDK